MIDVRKQYVFALFYKRLFGSAPDEWMLLGGNALLVRLGGGRFTQDVDLAHLAPSLTADDLRAQLDEALGHDTVDGFTFRVAGISEHDRTDGHGYGTRTLKVRVEAVLAGQVFEPFSLDVSPARHLSRAPERQQPQRIIDDPSLDDLPWVPVVPLENHVADKVCALYERHKRDSPSTRWRDLADLVRIVRALPLDGSHLAEVLGHEQGRRGLTLPMAMESPDPAWVKGYPRACQGFADFPVAFHDLQMSLTLVGQCLDPLLDGTRRVGRWDPTTQAWRD